MRHSGNRHQEVVIRVFDDNYEVLRGKIPNRTIDLAEDNAAAVLLRAILPEAIHLGRTLENEPMRDVRVEAWTVDGETLIARYAGGALL